MVRQPKLSASHSLTEWLNFLDRLDPARIELGLTRVRIVASTLGVLSFPCPIITIAGTNGKGSTVALLQAMYAAAGYRVGCYTSPHLHHFSERIRINETNVSDQVLCHALATVESSRGEVPLSYFEFTTLAALLIFQRAPLDLIVLEVGLGGRLDAVNVVDPTVAVITSIALDHCEYLGSSRESIAREKAGIFRDHGVAVCGESDPPASLVEAVKARAINAFYRGREFTITERAEEWDWQTLDTAYRGLPRPSLELDNAATALMVLHRLQRVRPVPLCAIQQGLQGACLVGRWQRLATKIPTYVDVAHNPAAALKLAKRLQALNVQGRVMALCGMLARKDITGTLQPLLDCVDEWYVTDLAVKEAASVEALQLCLWRLGIKKVYAQGDPKTAYEAMTRCAQPNDCIVVFGSFHTIEALVPFSEKARYNATF